MTAVLIGDDGLLDTVADRQAAPEPGRAGRGACRCTRCRRGGPPRPTGGHANSARCRSAPANDHRLGPSPDLIEQFKAAPNPYQGRRTSPRLH
jgi:hypothetical protein